MALFDLKVEIIVDDIITIRLAHPFECDDLLASAWGLREAKAHRRLVGFRSFDTHHATELLDAILSLCSLAGFCTEAINEILKMGDLFLLVTIGGELLFLTCLFLFQTGIEISRIANEFTVTNLHNATADEIQKFPIVRNRQNRSRISHQVVLKPPQRFKIEMVGGLIQQEKIRLLHKQSG